MAEDRVAVIGAGAVGCYFGGMLARSGVRVTLIGRLPNVDAIERDGLFIDGLRIKERVRVDTSTEIHDMRDAKTVLFCVKTVDTAATARAICPYVSDDCTVVSMQNGVDNVQRLNADGVAAIPAVVYVAAAMSGPGHVKHSGRGDLVVPSEAAGLAAMFEKAEVACRLSPDIRVELWQKMVMNCAYNAISALGRAKYGPIARNPRIRELMRRAIGETVAVARAEGVELNEDAVCDAAWKLGEAMSEATSSTAQDIERGKPTEIDSLNGYIARRGADLGIDTPVNETLTALVKLLEQRNA
jgi:2-dehydropantoate 2-reductase